MSVDTTPPRVAVAALYPEVAPELERYARRLGLTPNEADDVVSESFATLLSLEDSRLSRIENLRAYLFTMVRNLAARTAQRRGRVVPVPDEELDEPVVSEDPLVVSEDHSLARAAFAGLTRPQQSVLRLTLVDRLSAREAADRLGISPTNVRTQAQRARAALRESYVTAFLQARPPDCGTAPVLVARVVLGTASSRKRARFEEHVLTCPECASLLEQARAQASSRALVGVLALGGVATGGSWTGVADDRAADAAPEGRAEQARPSRSARRGAEGRSGRWRLTSAAGLLLLLVLVTTVGVCGAVGMRSAALGPSAPEALPAIGIAATPERIALDMPAPGASTEWEVTLTSSSDVTVSVVLATVGSLSPGSVEEPVFELGRAGAVLVGPTPLGGLVDTLYLGEIQPGESLTFDGALARSATDTDQTLAGTTELRFSAGVGLGAGLSPGDALDPTVWSSDGLAVTGASLAAASVAVVGLVVLGVVLVRRTGQHSARRRARRA